MQNKTFTAADLEKALKNDEFGQSGIELVGMVKTSEKAGHIGFTKSGCDAWVDLPTGMIDQAEHLGQNPCKGHSHPVFKITLKEAKNPEARILSALLAQPISMQLEPTEIYPFSGPQGYPQTQSQQGSIFSNYPQDFETGSTFPLPQTSARFGTSDFDSGDFGGFGGGLDWRFCWWGSCCQQWIIVNSPTGPRRHCVVYRRCRRCFP